jgi:hypothetical protein
MLRRTAISALWFFSILCMHELAWSLFGSPRVLGIILGGLAAAFVWFDPIAQFHASPRPRFSNSSATHLVPGTGLAPR